MDDFYILKMAYHFYELVFTLIFHLKRPDFPEYCLHHIITFALIGFSYSTNFLPIGSVIMFAHDFSDVFNCIMRITTDLVSPGASTLLYLNMTVIWVYFRLWFFPFYLMKGYYDEVSNSSHIVI